MNIPDRSVCLRIYLGDGARHGGKALFEEIVIRAHNHGLAGATVIRSPLGFGAASQLRTAKILNLSTDLPIVIEIIDGDEKIRAFIPLVKEVLAGGLVTLHEVEVVHYPTPVAQS